MKTKLALLALIVTSVSCGTGTIVEFGKDGISIIPPKEPVVIPTK